MLAFICGMLTGWFICKYINSVKEDNKKLDDDLEYIEKKLQYIKNKVGSGY